LEDLDIDEDIRVCSIFMRDCGFWLDSLG